MLKKTTEKGRKKPPKYSVLEYNDCFVLLDDLHDDRCNMHEITTNPQRTCLDVFRNLGNIGKRRLLYVDAIGHVDELAFCKSTGQFIRFNVILSDSQQFFFGKIADNARRRL